MIHELLDALNAKTLAIHGDISRLVCPACSNYMLFTGAVMDAAAQGLRLECDWCVKSRRYDWRNKNQLNVVLRAKNKSRIPTLMEPGSFIMYNSPPNMHNELKEKIYINMEQCYAAESKIRMFMVIGTMCKIKNIEYFIKKVTLMFNLKGAS
jgi:NAD-dependent SIR2 family protein deacetylase